MVFKRVRIILSKKMLKRVGESRYPWRTQICGSEPFSYVVVMVDCADHFVVEAFYGFDQIVIDVIEPYGCQQSCMPNSVERFLKVHEDMVKALLVFAGISHRVF